MDKLVYGWKNVEYLKQIEAMSKLLVVYPLAYPTKQIMELAGCNNFEMETEILVLIQTRIYCLNSSSDVQTSNDRYWQLQ